MSTVRLEAVAKAAAAAEIPMQPASWDIWDKKYRLKTKQGDAVDADIDGTYQRVARALADAEPTAEKQKYWYDRFLWALRRGAIPAGRITSNAGALEHKPATSTINCTVSGTITDSMDGILEKVHEAGLTLKAGCGIGYEFSTLRPRGAFVVRRRRLHLGPAVLHGYLRQDVLHRVVGRWPSRRADGHLRRRHPDVKEFIGAKREDGRLRQFNLSLLITDELHAGGREPIPTGRWCSRSTRRKSKRHRSGRRRAGRLARMADHPQLRHPRRRPGGLQDLRPHPRAAPVEHDHGVHLRLRRAGLHPDRPRQRDEQQLVVREHPRDQPLRRAAAAARTAPACSARST